MTAADGHAGDALARQQALRTRCAHPTGTFERFEKSQVEQSIPAPFERVVRRAPPRSRGALREEPGRAVDPRSLRADGPPRPPTTGGQDGKRRAHLRGAEP